MKPLVIFTALLVCISSGVGGDPTAVQGAMTNDRAVGMAEGFLADPCTLEVVDCDYEETIEEKIIKGVEGTGVDFATALRIAHCESGLSPTARNNHSTAKGLYQFTDPTWKWIKAEGHQFDVDESIKQFVKWYPKYPGWWECK